MPYPHLVLQREEPSPEKRPGKMRPTPPPADPGAHGRALQERLTQAVAETEADIGGFDERRLFKFEVQKGFNPDELRKVSTEIEIVSQEDEQVIVAFVSAAALRTFEARLSSLSRGEKPVYANVLYALNSFNGWTADDRTGWALRRDGFPDGENFVLDVELWPIEDNPQERQQLTDSFAQWLADNNIRNIDSVRHAGIIIYRVRCNRRQAESLLHHRDVRTVDLPPQYLLETQILRTDVQALTPPVSPSEDAPRVGILDSGIVANHPLLGPAVGGTHSFIPGQDGNDTNGHGTNVAGITLYGDVAKAVTDNAFVPSFWICSGRILDGNAEADAVSLRTRL